MCAKIKCNLAIRKSLNFSPFAIYRETLFPRAGERGIKSFLTFRIYVHTVQEEPFLFRAREAFISTDGKYLPFLIKTGEYLFSRMGE